MINNSLFPPLPCCAAAAKLAAAHISIVRYVIPSSQLSSPLWTVACPTPLPLSQAPPEPSSNTATFHSVHQARFDILSAEPAYVVISAPARPKNVHNVLSIHPHNAPPPTTLPGHHICHMLGSSLHRWRLPSLTLVSRIRKFRLLLHNYLLCHPQPNRRCCCMLSICP